MDDTIRVVALQNPVLPTAPIALSLIQNNYFAQPIAAAGLHPYPWEWPRLLTGAIGTALQVMRSDTTVVLNPAYPRYWERWSRVRVMPNRLEGSLGVSSQQTRSRVITVVTSFYGFRGLHLAIAAFGESNLGHEGWQMVIHAASGGPGYEARCRKLADGITGITFADPGEPARRTLSSAAVALFPSRIEGSSIAFLEALQLGPKIIAFDAPHFRAGVSGEGCESAIDWVRSWRAAEWASRLRSAAHCSPFTMEGFGEGNSW